MIRELTRQRIGDLRLEDEWVLFVSPGEESIARIESIKGALDWVLNTGVALPDILMALAWVVRDKEDYAQKAYGKRCGATSEAAS